MARRVTPAKIAAVSFPAARVFGVETKFQPGERAMVVDGAPEGVKRRRYSLPFTHAPSPSTCLTASSVWFRSAEVKEALPERETRIRSSRSSVVPSKSTPLDVVDVERMT